MRHGPFRRVLRVGNSPSNCFSLPERREGLGFRAGTHGTHQKQKRRIEETYGKVRGSFPRCIDRGEVSRLLPADKYNDTLVAAQPKRFAILRDALQSEAAQCGVINLVYILIF